MKALNALGQQFGLVAILATLPHHPRRGPIVDRVFPTIRHRRFPSGNEGIGVPPTERRLCSAGLDAQ